MVRRVNVFAPRLCDHDPQRVLDHSTLAFIVPHQRRKHRQAGRVAGSPAGGTQRIGIQIEFRAVRRLPAGRGQFRQPRFPNRASPEAAERKQLRRLSRLAFVLFSDERKAIKLEMDKLGSAYSVLPVRSKRARRSARDLCIPDAR